MWPRFWGPAGAWEETALRAGAQAVGAGDVTITPFAEVFDYGDAFAPATPDRITVPAGVTRARVYGMLGLTGPSSGVADSGAWLTRSGTKVAGAELGVGTNNPALLSMAAILAVTPGDLLRLLSTATHASAAVLAPAAPDYRVPTLAAEPATDQSTHLYATAGGQSLTANTWLRVTLNGTRWDDGGWAGANRITVPTAGRYRVWARMGFGSSPATHHRAMYVKKNGTTYLAANGGQRSSATAIPLPMAIAFPALLAAGDYLELWAVCYTQTVPTSVVGEVGPALAVERDSAIGTCLYQSALQSIPSGANTVVTLGGTRWDDGGWAGANRVTVPTSGRYRVFGRVRYTDGNANGPDRVAAIRRNGTDYLWGARSGQFQWGQGEVACAGLVELTAGDYLELVAYQNAGVAINTVVTADQESSLAVEAA